MSLFDHFYSQFWHLPTCQSHNSVTQLEPLHTGKLNRPVEVQGKGWKRGARWCPGLGKRTLPGNIGGSVRRMFCAWHRSASESSEAPLQTAAKRCTKCLNPKYSDNQMTTTYHNQVISSDLLRCSVLEATITTTNALPSLTLMSRCTMLQPWI